MGKLAEIKTKATDSSVEDFIAKVPNEQRRKDSLRVLKLMQKVSKEKPKMWGTAIIGFGDKRYKSPTADREVDWFRVGFSPRKAALTLYLIDLKSHAAALEKLGKYKTSGGGCLYINKLEDIDLKVLEGMIKEAIKGK